MSSFELSGSAKQSAGPPILKVVWSRISSSKRKRAVRPATRPLYCYFRVISVHLPCSVIPIAVNSGKIDIGGNHMALALYNTMGRELPDSCQSPRVRRGFGVAALPSTTTRISATSAPTCSRTPQAFAPLSRYGRDARDERHRHRHLVATPMTARTRWPNRPGTRGIRPRDRAVLHRRLLQGHRAA